MVENGDIDLYKMFTLNEENLKSPFDIGIVHNFQPGCTLSLHDLIFCMITVSDYVATTIVGNLFTIEQINIYCKQVGITSTYFNAIELPGPGSDMPPSRVALSTPKDIGFLLQLLVKGSMGNDISCKMLGCSQNSCQFALKILSRQKLTSRIPLLLPKSTVVCNKTGTFADIVNDVGIVYETKLTFAHFPKCILAIFVHDIPNEVSFSCISTIEQPITGRAAACVAIATLSRMIYAAYSLK